MSIVFDFRCRQWGQGVSRGEEADTMNGLQHDDLCFKLGKTASQKRYLDCHTLPRAACSFELTLQPLAHNQAPSDAAQRWGSLLASCVVLGSACSKSAGGWVSWGRRALRRRPRCLSLSFPPTPDLTVRRGHKEHLCSHASRPNNSALRGDLRTF